MKGFRYSFFGLRLSLVFLIILTSSCDNRQPTQTTANNQKISIAVSTTPLSAPFFVAQANGYFKQQGLDVTIIDTIGGHHCLNAVLTDTADMGTASEYPVMIQSFKRDDFVIAATFVTSSNDVKFIANRKKIKNITDIKGMNIGTVIGASSHYFLDRFLLFNGMSLKDVNVIPLNAEDMPTALNNSQVDALSVWEPYGYLSNIKLKENSHIFPTGEYYRETFNLTLKKSYVKQHPERLRKTLLALEKAVNFIKQNPIQAQQIIISRLNLDDKFINWIWKDFKFALNLDQSLLVTLENQATWASENKITQLEKPKNFLNYIHVETLKSINSSNVSIIY